MKPGGAIRGSITKKLFFITMIIFISFLTFTLVCQRVLFEKIYYNKKKANVEANVSKFYDTLSNSNNQAEIVEAMKQYEDNYNTFMAIVDLNSNITITFKTGFERIDMQKNTMVKEILNEIRRDSVLNEELSERGKVTFVPTQPRSTTQNLVSVLMDESKIIIGVTSLQYIKEAVDVIEIFYEYFYVAAIIVITFLSIVYSRMITGPLRKINKVANKMSDLDFSEKCNVNSEDEIGNLAITLNFLSSKLQDALSSLKSANRKLQADIDKERKLENMRKEFIADVSHELKTPITLIKGYAEGIKDDVFSEEERAFSLDVIISESDKMSNLVKDMLELSSLESGTMKLMEEICDIGEIISTTIKKLKPSMEDKSITLQLDLAENLKVKGDSFKLEQVITNFLTNAIRYTPENGEVWVTAKGYKEKAYISFENSGEPIEEEKLSKIWDKFYKIDKSRNRNLGGTGLGLSIVKNIIELHRGSFGARNTERGVMFYFAIDMVKDDVYNY